MTTTDIQAERITLIRQRLEGSLQPLHIDITDDSHLHKGHPGALESGGGHFTLEIVSNHFNQQSTLERHRMIYAALGDAMGTEIHALSIQAQTPDEANLNSPT